MYTAKHIQFSEKHAEALPAYYRLQIGRAYCIKKVKNQEIIYYERNITIKNDIYKNGVFKFIIILTDYETRENNAYIQFLNDDYTYQFDTNKIHYKNYDQAIKSFKKKGNTYTNKDYQIVVTKNKIITTYRGSR